MYQTSVGFPTSAQDIRCRFRQSMVKGMLKSLHTNKTDFRLSFVYKKDDFNL